MKLLITGSRDISPRMLDITRNVIDRRLTLAPHELTLVVGDAGGVDKCAMDYAHQLGISCHIWGINGRHRNKTPSASLFHINGNYLMRDIAMAQVCDICYAIWNGSSTGTIYTYNAAKQLGHKSFLYNNKTDHWS